MAVDRDEMLRVLRAFQDEGLEYVLIGATAMALHGLVRATEDRFLRHCARFWALAPRTYPWGVFKFRSIEEAQAARESVTNADKPVGSWTDR